MSCNKCGAVFKWKDKRLHYSQCPSACKCPNDCGAVVSKKKINKHLKKCRKEVLVCPCKCTKKIARCELLNHLPTCVEECVAEYKKQIENGEKCRRESESREKEMEATIKHMKIAHQQQMSSMEEQLRCQVAELETCGSKESKQTEVERLMAQKLAQDPECSICVGNVPPQGTSLRIMDQ